MWCITLGFTDTLMIIHVYSEFWVNYETLIYAVSLPPASLPICQLLHLPRPASAPFVLSVPFDSSGSELLETKWDLHPITCSRERILRFLMLSEI